jgi:hypothetical protein
VKIVGWEGTSRAAANPYKLQSSEEIWWQARSLVDNFTSNVISSSIDLRVRAGHEIPRLRLLMLIALGDGATASHRLQACEDNDKQLHFAPTFAYRLECCCEIGQRIPCITPTVFLPRSMYWKASIDKPSLSKYGKARVDSKPRTIRTYEEFIQDVGTCLKLPVQRKHVL